MTTKQYTFCRLAIVIVLSMSISISISLENYYLPLIFMITAAAGLYYCRQQLQANKVIVDERDYQVAGTAARYSLYIYSWIGAIGTFVLMALSKREGLFYALSQYLAISVCFLMILNSLLFKYLSKRNR